ncbi:hypothetical protein BSKO_06856 [Bryopsis sp. KO-2023]|nr:hypothetical protein BSKO_06856 [Bryopsis sp. KO-2023]
MVSLKMMAAVALLGLVATACAVDVLDQEQATDLKVAAPRIRTLLMDKLSFHGMFECLAGQLSSELGIAGLVH